MMDAGMTAFDFAAMCRCGKKLSDCNMPAMAQTDAKVLPPTVEPMAYKLDLAPRLADHEFDGTVAITVAVVEPVYSITLHANELKVHTAMFMGVGTAIDISLGEGDDTTVTCTFASEIPTGTGTLTLTFTGIHNDKMNGFYRSEYTDVKGEKKLMVSSQCEPIDARKIFPCWDEPLRKATFTCSLRVPSHMTALSNMPESRSLSHGDGTKTVTFLESPRMSTYLLAFVVGEFDHVSALTKRGVLIRVFCPPGKPELGMFALECACNALDLYDEAFGQPYPLPKSDMVAIPEFAAGAMENWGLVTYREVDLLIDESASSRQRQRVAEVVIHELAHQWFGNLVTMAWWDDLWLNEGFATWMETGITASLYPEWKMWEQFITDMQGRALDLDALRSSHPIQVPIGDAKEVDEVFDAISYCKGGAVIRMVHAVVGEAAFKSGLRNYMAAFKYGNATTDDLWAAWEDASGQPIKKLMGLWTKQMGFPLLELTSVENGSTLKLSQKWFVADGSAIDPKDAKNWPIPIFAQSSVSDGAISEMDIMTTGSHSLNLKSSEAGTCDPIISWVKLNAGQHVPMRVKYPDSMIPNLGDAVRKKIIPAADRIGLLSDQSALARAGQLDPVRYLEVLASYVEEDDATVLGMLLERLQGLHALFKDTPALSAAFATFANTLVQPQIAKLGWDPAKEDGHLTRKLRGEVIAALPSLCAKDPAVLTEAKKRFATYCADPEPSKPKGKEVCPPEIAAPIFKICHAAGGEAEYETLLSLFKTLELNDDKKQALFGMGYAPTDALKQKALDYALTSEVKTQDFFYLMLTMHRASAAGTSKTWAHFQANLPAYLEKVKGGSGSLLDAVISGACSGFTTKEKADEVQAFFESKPKEFEKNQRKITQTLEAIRTNSAYLERFTAGGALAWLQAYKGGVPVA